MFDNDQEDKNKKKDKHSNDDTEEKIHEHKRNIDIVQKKMNSINKFEGVKEFDKVVNNMKRYYSINHKTNKKWNLSEYCENDENMSKEIKMEEINTYNMKNIKNMNSTNNINYSYDYYDYYDGEKKVMSFHITLKNHMRTSLKNTHQISKKRSTQKIILEEAFT